VQQPSAGLHRLGDIPHWLLFSIWFPFRHFSKVAGFIRTAKILIYIKRAEMHLMKETNSFSSRIFIQMNSTICPLQGGKILNRLKISVAS